MTALLPWYGLSDSEFESEFDSEDPGDEDSLGVLDDASRSPDRWRRGHAQNSVVIPAEVLRPHFTAPDFGSDGHDEPPKRQRTGSERGLAPPRITEESLRSFSTQTGFDEGRRDFLAGCVSPIVYDANGTLRATVSSLRTQTERFAAHSVVVSFDQDHILGAKCSCAVQGHFFRFNFCSHTVAVLLSLARSRDTTLSRTQLQDAIRALPREVLESTLLHVLQEGKDFDALRSQLSVSVAASLPRAFLPASDLTLLGDEADLRERIARALSGEHSTYAQTMLMERNNDFSSVLMHLRAMLADGRLALALKVAPILMEEAAKALSGQYQSPASLADLRLFWLDAMLHFDLTDAERSAWAEKLEDWARSLPILHPAPVAARNGWNTETLVALLRGESKPYDEPEQLFEARVACLRKARRMQEALNFVRATRRRLYGHAQREFITDLLVNRFVDEALSDDVTQGLDPEERFYLAKHVASVRPFGAIRVALAGLRDVDHPRWHQFREPTAMWVLNHAIECDLFLNRSRQRPLPVPAPKAHENQCLVQLKDVPPDASVPSLYMLCVRRIGVHRSTMTQIEWNELIADLPVQVKASLMVEEVVRACCLSHHVSQEHVLRCCVLLQLKGYTQLALDTLCQTVNDNIVAYRYLLQQAIASRQQRLLDDSVARLIERSEFMGASDHIIIACLQELSESRPFDALRVICRMVRNLESPLIPTFMKLCRDVPTGELLSLTVLEDAEERTSGVRYAFYQIALVMADRDEHMHAARLAMRCLHTPRYVNPPPEWLSRVGAFLGKEAAAASVALGQPAVYDELRDAWMKWRSAPGYMKLRELAKQFGLWEAHSKELNDYVTLINADVVQKLEIRLDEGNHKDALDLWTQAMDEGNLTRFVDRFLQAAPGLGPSLLDRMYRFVWEDLWRRRVGSYFTVTELGRTIQRLAGPKFAAEALAASEAAEPMAAVGQMLHYLTASRPTYVKLVTHLRALLPACQRAGKMHVFQEIINFIRMNHAGKRTLLALLDQAGFPQYTRAPVPAAAAPAIPATLVDPHKRRK